MEEIIPKGSKLMSAKIKGIAHIQVFYIDKEILFVQLRDWTFVPHLKIIHKYPTMCKIMKVDKGAIRHIISGADVMCPGLTSEGGVIDDEA